jgi:hypothetical protein
MQNLSLILAGENYRNLSICKQSIIPTRKQHNSNPDTTYLNLKNFFFPPKITQSYGSKTPAVCSSKIYRDGRVIELDASSLAIKKEFASRQYIFPHKTFGKGRVATQ